MSRERRDGPGRGHVHGRLRRIPRAGAAAAVAIALAAAVGACGGGSGGAANSASGASKTAQQPLHVTVAPGQLPVAEELGPDIVAAEVSVASGQLALKIHTLSGTELPAAIPITLAHAKVLGSCGLGCYRASAPAGTSTLIVKAHIGGSAYTAALPIGFEPGGDRLAQTLLRNLDAGQERLRSAAVYQSLRNSPTQMEITNFQIGAPDRFAYQLIIGGKQVGATIIIGRSEWGRDSGTQAWQPSSYGSQPFSAADYLDWWNGSDGSPRLLDLHGSGSHRVADVATLTMVPQLGPVWMRFHIDVSAERLLHFRMITVEHFMTQIWKGFNVTAPIKAPSDVAAAPSG